MGRARIPDHGRPVARPSDDYPYVKVVNVDTKEVRHFRMFPQDAVMEAASEEMGQRGNHELVRAMVRRLPNGWQCGRFIAAEMTQP